MNYAIQLLELDFSIPALKVAEVLILNVFERRSFSTRTTGAL
jgi:hypothetical protein